MADGDKFPEKPNSHKEDRGAEGQRGRNEAQREAGMMEERRGPASEV